MSNESNRIRWRLGRVALPVACLALAVGYVELRRESASVAAPAGASNERAAALDARRIGALEREVRSLRAGRSDQAGQGRSVSIERPEGASEGDTATDEELTPAGRQRAREEQIAADLAARRQFLDELADRIDSEPVDPKWRATTQEQISTLFSKQLGTDVSIAAPACASTVCRVELEHPSQRRLPLAKLTELAMQRGDELGAMEIHYDTKSRDGATTVYLVRSGDDTAGVPDDG